MYGDGLTIIEKFVCVTAGYSMKSSKKSLVLLTEESTIGSLLEHMTAQLRVSSRSAEQQNSPVSFNNSVRKRLAVGEMRVRLAPALPSLLASLCNAETATFLCRGTGLDHI